ncbi:hypothetical protein BAUCODRAFT_78054 [Baudoinia panamericana UAMH 10762]|uniref:Major facilitator superfamily (MFS) profile domain-containing protein n=1 Tax=Baudoinia panamericana (strain UAMH 10762) TaxID=717646 RepID=M2M7T4_BAUPA|nr:uncharacterized protein BAUCODRAFT_78054 [Baudoinia panamericana UAMH 10762]EMC92391.1 hypothetical protein BAUCODRAFT_78054 [Baudoinia panamericana UAMH 10762]
MQSQEAVRSESDSILEAIEVGSADDDHDSELPDLHDLEKAATSTTQHTKGEPAARTLTAQDWTGPDDPENPHNWQLWRRNFTLFGIASLAFTVTAGSSMITPATFEIAAYYGVSRTASILSLSLFVLGLGLGPMLAAPLSETYGRSIVYKLSGPLYMLFILGAGFSKNFGGMLVCRLLAGIVGGPVLAVGGGTVADMYTQKNRALGSAMFIMSPFLGPALGPVIGGFAAQYKGWKWTQWCTIFIALAAYAFVLPMPETYKKVILKRRAKRHNIPPPPAPAMTTAGYIKLLITITLARPLVMLFTEPIVLFFSLYNAFTFSVLFSFFAAYPYTFERVYGFNTWQYGLTFLGIGVGVILAVVTLILVDRLVYTPLHLQGVKEGKQNIAPEHRLYAAMAGAFGIPVGLFWFAWTARRSVHWISPVIAGMPFAWGNAAVFISVATYLVDVYGPLNGASALAANGLARYTMGAVFPLFTVQMYSTLGIGWATSLLAFVSVAMLPIPFVFFRFGPKIRDMSKYSMTAQQKK